MKSSIINDLRQLILYFITILNETDTVYSILLLSTMVLGIVAFVNNQGIGLAVLFLSFYLATFTVHKKAKDRIIELEETKANLQLKNPHSQIHLISTPLHSAYTQPTPHPSSTTSEQFWKAYGHDRTGMPVWGALLTVMIEIDNSGYQVGRLEYELDLDNTNIPLPFIIDEDCCNKLKLDPIRDIGPQEFDCKTTLHLPLKIAEEYHDAESFAKALHPPNKQYKVTLLYKTRRAGDSSPETSLPITGNNYKPLLEKLARIWNSEQCSNLLELAGVT